MAHSMTCNCVRGKDRLPSPVFHAYVSKEVTPPGSALRVHTFSDLTHVSPVVFSFLLKECYFLGTIKGKQKYMFLLEQVKLALGSSPQPGPMTFVAGCLYVLPIFDPFREGFSHLMLQALRCLPKQAVSPDDEAEAKRLAARLLVDILFGLINPERRAVRKMLEGFDIRLIEFEEAMGELKSQNDPRFDAATEAIQQYVVESIESGVHKTAASILERLSIRQFGPAFLLKLLRDRRRAVAETWASFMGLPMIRTLLQIYSDRNILKPAHKFIEEFNLQEEYPELYSRCRKSIIKKLAEKGKWEVAEMMAKTEVMLVHYLVYLAMEAGHLEKVDELCQRHSLEGFPRSNSNGCDTAPFQHRLKPEISSPPSRKKNLDIKEFVAEGLFWVDDADGLSEAVSHIEESRVVGIDCEWNPSFKTRVKSNPVSILQIASHRRVFIFDLIKLFEHVPHILDDHLTRIFQSPSILKLGYSVQCDINALSFSYRILKCFQHYEMLLDIQKVVGYRKGGLSALSKKILGVDLKKNIRFSDWELRPLGQDQLEYAAADAVVLIPIFDHLCCSSSIRELQDLGKNEWKSYLNCYRNKFIKKE